MSKITVFDFFEVYNKFSKNPSCNIFILTYQDTEKHLRCKNLFPKKKFPKTLKPKKSSLKPKIVNYGWKKKNQLKSPNLIFPLI
jgi:hypothetical protein